jgi:glycosyltransferase involved in cell wall biosynthesis
MNKILLIGQPIYKNRKGDVGSGGGYVRNMRVYLEYFQSEEFQLVPCFHTSRKEYGLNIFSKFIRIFIDIKRLLVCLFSEKPNSIHIMAQYRDALPRELAYVIISRIFNKSVLYEVKAGAFIDAIDNRSTFYKKMAKYILNNSKVILVEGKKYINYLKKDFGIESTYFPNVVPDNELPIRREYILADNVVKILYVGYCTYNKGVYHLADACVALTKDKIPVELNFVGEEDADFTEYLNNLKSNLVVNRFGGKHHEFILKKMKECDVFCYPSFHSGEGHSNSINEAMMNTMIIVSTKNGFLGDILDDNSAYFIDQKSTEDIVGTISEIYNNKYYAIEKAQNAYNVLKNNYLVSIVSRQIQNSYRELVR